MIINNHDPYIINHDFYINLLNKETGQSWACNNVNNATTRHYIRASGTCKIT